MLRIFIFKSVITTLVLLSASAQSQTNGPTVKSISIFRNEIQLEANRNPDVRVGSKFSAKLPVPHKCVLVVTRIVNRTVYADATQCPGYATLKKGQQVEVSVEKEIKQEPQSTTELKETS